MKNTLLILFIIVAFLSKAQAQNEDEVNTVGFRFLDYQSNYLPKDLLSSKCAVIVSVPPKSKESSERGNWKKLAEEGHSYFYKLGIDPVMYYYIDDVFAGRDLSKTIAEEMKKRGITNIILLSHVIAKIKEKEIERYVIVITPFSGDDNFISNGQPAWKDQNSDSGRMLNKLAKTVSKSSLKKENLMILEKPEYFRGIDFLKGGRNESFNVDLRVDKLAVPRIPDIEIPTNMPGGTINNQIKKEVELANKANVRLNSELEQEMASYPYKYGFVDADYDEKKLINEGYLFVLQSIKTSGRSIRNLLEYEPSTEEDLVTIKQKPSGSTVFRRIPQDAPVYKYYIKHLRTGDVYLGVQWDADETWREALKNHLFFLTNFLNDHR